MRIRIRYILWTFLVLGAFLAATAYALMFSSVTGEYDAPRSVLIPRGSTVEQVADSLASAGILKDRFRFLAFSSLSGWGDQIKAGHYVIASGSSNRDILDRIRRGLQEPVRVRVPAGSTPDRIATSIAAKMAFSASELLEALSDSEFVAELGSDSTQLLGYLLPETYSFYWLTDPRAVLKKIASATDALLNEKRSRSDNAPALNNDEIVTLASIVEWETAVLSEKATIAGVYLNRLRNGWPLQADPTVQFAVMEREGAKRRLLFKDYKIRHPYNTYRYAGLPPGPITNPSPSSIEAVLHPESHDFYYFVAKGDGTHIFSRTLAEHRRNANAYYRLMRERRRTASND